MTVVSLFCVQIYIDIPHIIITYIWNFQQSWGTFFFLFFLSCQQSGQREVIICHAQLTLKAKSGERRYPITCKRLFHCSPLFTTHDIYVWREFRRRKKSYLLHLQRNDLSISPEKYCNGRKDAMVSAIRTQNSKGCGYEYILVLGFTLE